MQSGLSSPGKPGAITCQLLPLNKYNIKALLIKLTANFFYIFLLFFRCSDYEDVAFCLKSIYSKKEYLFCMNGSNDVEESIQAP